MTFQEALEQAAALIEGAAKILDSRVIPCCECGGHQHQNRSEYQNAVQLTAMVDKCRRFATHPDYSGRVLQGERGGCHV